MNLALINDIDECNSSLIMGMSSTSWVLQTRAAWRLLLAQGILPAIGFPTYAMMEATSMSLSIYRYYHSLNRNISYLTNALVGIAKFSLVAYIIGGKIMGVALSAKLVAIVFSVSAGLSVLQSLAGLIKALYRQRQLSPSSPEYADLGNQAMAHGVAIFVGTVICASMLGVAFFPLLTSSIATFAAVITVPTFILSFYLFANRKSTESAELDERHAQTKRYPDNLAKSQAYQLKAKALMDKVDKKIESIRLIQFESSLNLAGVVSWWQRGKRQDKVDALKYLKRLLKNPQSPVLEAIDKAPSLQHYYWQLEDGKSQAFQSFFKDTGGVSELFDEAESLLKMPFSSMAAESERTLKIVQ